jgi:predicted DNA-binding protein (MmcQ/YjbR family)
MNAERVRTFLLGLPHVVETAQWGGVVFWVGDKAIGGKMFAMLNPDGGQHPVSYPAGQDRFAELVERDGIIPAPYMARIWWVTVERWDALREREWEDELRAGHAMVYEKLPPKVKKVLALPKAEFKLALEAGRKRRAEWELAEAAKKAAKRKTKSPVNLE